MGSIDACVTGEARAVTSHGTSFCIKGGSRGAREGLSRSLESVRVAVDPLVRPSPVLCSVGVQLHVPRRCLIKFLCLSVCGCLAGKRLS